MKHSCMHMQSPSPRAPVEYVPESSSSELAEQDIWQAFRCPISLAVMADPVLAPSGELAARLAGLHEQDELS